MNILVVNCGSSSLKYQLLDMNTEKVLAKGLVERIGSEGAILTQKVEGKDKYVIEQPMESHKVAIKLVLNALVDSKYGVIKDMSEIGAVGHRILHGGEKCTKSVLLNKDVMDIVRDCIKLGPLHNPANITGIEACRDAMPDTPMVGVFDTAFHQTMPDYAYTYALPYELYKKYAIRKYGFHGTSHNYVSSRAAELLHKDIKDLKIISCHLGNGASVTAVKDGKCIDTSMGFTPLAGLVMGTRSGDIDPAVVTFLIKELNISADEANSLLNKKSGVLGISGVSSDFRDVEKAAKEGNDRARLALQVFYYRVKQYIGSYAAIMGGVDCVIFTAGIGENSFTTRAKICEGLEFLGIKVDPSKNENARGVEKEISSDGAKVKVWVIPTNEELMIARDTKRIVTSK